MKNHRNTKTITLFIGFLFVSFFITNGNGKGTWFTKQEWAVINTNATANDYAAVNQGQLKWMAKRAYDAMSASESFNASNDVPMGEFPSASQLVAGFNNSNNYTAVNIGQVKNVAVPFYNWMINEGLTNAFPWEGAAETNDFGIANIGQIKNVFNLPVN